MAQAGTGRNMAFPRWWRARPAPSSGQEFNVHLRHIAHAQWGIGVEIGILHAAFHKFRALVQRQAGTLQRSAFDLRQGAVRMDDGPGVDDECELLQNHISEPMPYRQLPFHRIPKWRVIDFSPSCRRRNQSAPSNPMISAINGPSVAETTVSQDCTDPVRRLSIEIPTHSLSVKSHHPLGMGYVRCGASLLLRQRSQIEDEGG